MTGEQFVIRLQDGRYWINKDSFTGNPHAAAKYDSRWLALDVMNKAGPIMHQASILRYLRPSETEATNPPTKERN